MSGETNKLLRDYGVAVTLAVVIAFLIRSFVLEAYRIPSPAMRPTLEPGDTIFVGKMPWISSGKFQHGDVVLFRSLGAGSRDFVKRVVAVPGDKVEIKAGRLHVDGVDSKLDLKGECGTETLKTGVKHGVCFEPPPLDNFGPIVIPEGQIFVLGDLRTRSIVDTRSGVSWGPIDVKSIRGKALWIWLSIEPRGPSPSSWFPQFRFDRMFRRIE